jgi:NAD(P)-dependent dehydrogenase (short-subunit alcohol dehydrogenase family)
MAWTAADIPRPAGRVVAVVTGANGGLGLEVARGLARKGGHVVMAARDHAKAEAARASIHQEVPDALLELQPLDLASPALGARDRRPDPDLPTQDRHPGQQRRRNGHPPRRTTEGFETQLAVNHFGHFTPMFSMRSPPERSHWVTLNRR